MGVVRSRQAPGSPALGPASPRQSLTAIAECNYVWKCKKGVWYINVISSIFAKVSPFIYACPSRCPPQRHSNATKNARPIVARQTLAIRPRIKIHLERSIVSLSPSLWGLDLLCRPPNRPRTLATILFIIMECDSL